MATHFVYHLFKCNGSRSKCYGNTINVLWQHAISITRLGEMALLLLLYVTVSAKTYHLSFRQLLQYGSKVL